MAGSGDSLWTGLGQGAHPFASFTGCRWLGALDSQVPKTLSHPSDFVSFFGFISSGATSAPSLIFILPSIFYIRIVPNEKEPLLSRSKIQVGDAIRG